MEWIVIFLIGISMGSFLTVLIDRLPREENVIVGRSHCDGCKKPLRWFELIPVISYVLQGGICRRCHMRLSMRYPLFEVITGCLYCAVYFLLPIEMSASWYMIHLLSWWLIVSSVFVLTVTDLEHQILPDSMLIGLLIGGIGRMLPFSYTALFPLLLSSLGAGGLFYLLWFLTRGKGMGFGDVKLAGVLGGILGFPAIVVALYVAFLTGALIGVILMILGSAGMKTKIAFGPFLLLGAFVSYFWTIPILHFFQLV